MAKRIGFENEQVVYAQQSMKELKSKGYSDNEAAQIHLDSLRFISAIKTMDLAVQIVYRAARLNGMTVNFVK